MLIRALLICLLWMLTACSGTGGRFDSDYAAGRYLAKPVQCVPYARQLSGIQIHGDAYTWWGQAANRYMRGNIPQPGAVMVLSRTDRMRHGHVAVVKRLVNARTIEVAHTNWGSDAATRRMAYDRMRVEDISAGNDWSIVRFWNYQLKTYGLPYAVSGFIYPS